jgi:putative transposase
MIRAFRYPLRPTKEQEATLDAWRVACCDLYNGALQHRRDAWNRQRVSVSLYSQQVELTRLRAQDAEWATIPVWIARSPLARIDRAFQAFCRRVKAGQAPGFPRFRSRDRYDSFDLGSNPVRVDGDRVSVPKLGMVKFHKYREMSGDVKLVSVGRSARGWYVSFVCDVGVSPTKAPVRSTVGIDVGLEVFATLSNGERVDNPRFFRESAETLARRQQSLAKKCRGSSSRKRAKALVARAHEHIRNQRLDFARKFACALFSRFDLVAYEDLAISRMVHGNLAKSIHDAGWGVAINALTSKAESAGKWAVAIDPRGTSQMCARCGAVVKKTLDEREHSCPSCGFVTHRDHNAALNIEARGLRVGQLTEIAGTCNMAGMYATSPSVVTSSA